MRAKVFIIAVIAIAAIALIFAGTLPKNQGDTDMNQESDVARIAPGEVWTLSLDENPTTGYAWSVISSEGLIVYDDYRSGHSDDSKTMVGSGGIREYRITADEPGEYVFSAKYSRSWETTEYDEIVTVKLIVESNE